MISCVSLPSLSARIVTAAGSTFSSLRRELRVWRLVRFAGESASSGKDVSRSSMLKIPAPLHIPISATHWARFPSVLAGIFSSFVWSFSTGELGIGSEELRFVTTANTVYVYVQVQPKVD